MNLSGIQKELHNLRIELVESKDAESRLAQLNVELCDRFARLTEKHNRLDVETEISINKRRDELDKKQTEILKLKRKVSEIQTELEIAFSALVKSKDAERQQAQMISELHVRIARIIVTQKGPGGETVATLSAKLSAARKKLGTTEAALAAKQIALEDTQAKLKRRETDNPCSICLYSDRDSALLPDEVEILRTKLIKSKETESKLARMNAELYERNINITAMQTRFDVETRLTDTDTVLQEALSAKQRALEDAQAKLMRRESDTPCSICLNSDRDSALVPCGHVTTCYTCSLKLHTRDNAKCPVCRQSIHQVFQIYL